MSVIVSLYAIVFSGAIGTMLGIVAGYFGGIIDMIIVRIAEIKMAIPGLALALIFSATMDPGLSTVIIVIVLTYWTWYARIIRSEILSLRERDYVAFAKVAGCGSMTIFFRHLLPNIFNTLLVLMTLQVGQVILFEAALSFLGLGIQAPDTSWGLMLADARQYITYAWWGITMPGIAIMLTCLSPISPATGCATCSTRNGDSCDRAPLSESREPADPSSSAPRRGEGRGRHQLRGARGRDPGHRRRSPAQARP